jgi:hypothetical protein
MKHKGEFPVRKPLFIGIAVHKPKFLDTLPGVLEAHDDLCAWARQSYDVVSIDDRDKPVTIERIRSELTPDDGEGTPDPTLLLDRSRIVVYFAGHGFAAWPDQYWILSAGPNQSRERISANAFRDTLASYEPRQISFISDACRSPGALLGAGDAVVDRLEGNYRNPQKDVFYSCQDGKSSFAVPAKDGTPAYLVFSSVLLKALSAPDDGNLDVVLLMLKRRAVTSQSLSEFLEKNVPQAALDVDRTQLTQCDPGFRPLDHIYAEFAPAGDGVGPLETLETGAEEDTELDDEAPGGLPPGPSTEDKDVAAITSFIKSQFQLAENERLARHQPERMLLSSSEWRAPLVKNVGELLRAEASYDPLVGVVGADHPGLLLFDGTVKQPANIDPNSIVGKNVAGFRLGRPIVAGGETACITFGEHSISLVPIFEGMHGVCVIENFDEKRQGMEFLSWISIYGDDDDKKVLHSAEALKGLSRGYLRAADAKQIAAQIRYVKHLDPMMGVVAAYLYNAAGDIDNIRRMAYYYLTEYQPVPFDLAMLGGLQLEQTGRGFETEVPKVEAALEPDDTVPDFAQRETPAVRGMVAGLAPILRVGWPYLRNSGRPFHKMCWQFIDNLAPSPVTTFVGPRAVDAIAAAFQEEKL